MIELTKDQRVEGNILVTEVDDAITMQVMSTEGQINEHSFPRLRLTQVGTLAMNILIHRDVTPVVAFNDAVNMVDILERENHAYPVLPPHEAAEAIMSEMQSDTDEVDDAPSVIVQ